jgi:adenosyl cobinamide kinase/adenosyl cobinamide phosphate guanylyltransferase
MLTLLIGGARAGKSDAAVDLARKWTGPVVFVATAEARDDEMAARVARHQESRPVDWTTVEAPVELTAALSDAPSDSFVIVDCLTLWVSALMERACTDDEIERRSRDAASAAADRASPTVAVTNEVGSGIVPDNALARRFRDVLGSVNRIWSDHASRTFLIVAGRALPLDRDLGSHG